MPINLNIDRSNNLTTFVVYDQITADDVLETLKPVYEDPEKLNSQGTHHFLMTRLHVKPLRVIPTYSD